VKHIFIMGSTSLVDRRSFQITMMSMLVIGIALCMQSQRKCYTLVGTDNFQIKSLLSLAFHYML